MKRSVIAALIVTLSILLPYSSNAQTRKRVAVLGFDDHTVQTQPYMGQPYGMGQQGGISQRVTDQLISSLAGKSTFEVIDRENLSRIMNEQTQSYGNRFDAAGAVKLGKLANVSIVIIGQVDAFSANVTAESKQNLLGNKVKQNGVVDLRVTARVIQVDTGMILGAPSVESEQKAVLAQSSDHSSAFGGLAAGVVPMAGALAVQNAAMQNAAIQSGMVPNGGIQKLVDQAVSDASSQLAAKIEAMALSAPVAPVMPKFVGIENGLVVVNKGQNAGVKVGDKFEVTRITESSLVDPDTHQPITHKAKQCVFTVTVVEDSNASGTCDGANIPQAGDIFTTVAK